MFKPDIDANGFLSLSYRLLYYMYNFLQTLLLFFIFIVISIGFIVLVRPLYTWIFIVLDDNFLVGMFATEVYGPCEYLF